MKGIFMPGSLWDVVSERSREPRVGLVDSVSLRTFLVTLFDTSLSMRTQSLRDNLVNGQILNDDRRRTTPH